MKSFFKKRDIKINQISQFFLVQLKIGYKLSFENGLDSSYRFYLKNDFVFYQNIYNINFPQRLFFITKLNRNLCSYK